MLPVLKYTVMRLALFVVALGVMALVGAGPITAIALAALISMMLSYLLLRRPRDEVARRLSDRIQSRLQAREGGFAERIAADAAMEDAADEAARERPAD